jgi:MoaA/NifB/PqqE/SkfB family radical SAM enzyme
MNHSQIIRWAQELDGYGCFGIGFGGGEPTLYKQLPELCREVVSTTNLALTLTTHGHRFTSEFASKLANYVHFIRVSMDGVGSTYERLRGKSFAEFLDKLAIIRGSFKFGINYVVNDATITDLPKAADIAFENGAVELLLLPEIDKNGRVSLDERTKERLTEWVQRNYNQYRLATSEYGVDAINAPVLPINNTDYPGYDFMHIDASRTLKLCAFSSWGISLLDEMPLIDAIEQLRNKATLFQTKIRSDCDESMVRLWK